jgi:protein TonB
MAFIYENLKYPAAAHEQKIEGRVTVQFVIKANGDIDDVAVQKSADPLLDEEALRMVKLFPKWTPGKLKGKPVNVKFFLPIVFQLRQTPETE